MKENILKGKKSEGNEKEKFSLAQKTHHLFPVFHQTLHSLRKQHKQ